MGDLKLDIELDLLTSGGTLKLEVGSDRHCAVWDIPFLDVKPAPSPEKAQSIHSVRSETPLLSAGKHFISLAYVDGTVIATLDGKELERQKIEAIPLGLAAKNMKSIARVSFSGIAGKVLALNVSRDLYYTDTIDHYQLHPEQFISDRQRNLRYYEDGKHVAIIPEGQYLMLGDNSPTSMDGRIWGFVPRENIEGRALAVLWPPSRWQVFK